MRSIRAMLCFVLLLVGGGGGILVHPSTASATTGPTNPPPALYKVPQSIAMQFPGQYAIQTVAGGARISRGQMAIDFNGLNALSGVASFSGYDAHGHRMTWVGMLYQFHQTAKDGMVIDILAPATSQLFGRMYLHRLKGGNLVGQIALPATRYAITWRKNI